MVGRAGQSMLDHSGWMDGERTLRTKAGIEGTDEPRGGGGDRGGGEQHDEAVSEMNNKQFGGVRKK